MKGEAVATRLLATCSARLEVGADPKGTAFFVAPGYAVTAAHVVGGTEDLQVVLGEGALSWHGHVADVRPPCAQVAADSTTYPAPDIALIKVDDGPGHPCALLSKQFPDLGAWVMARGYTPTFDRSTVTAETESFRLSGMLETADAGCTLLKLGLGEVTRGMSGAPVLALSTGEVIGMLRTSRRLGSNLGGWVVPADLIRRLWPDEVGAANDRFHERDPRWRDLQLSGPSPKEGAPAPGGLSIGSIEGGVGAVITGGTIGTVNIGQAPRTDRHSGSGDTDGR